MSAYCPLASRIFGSQIISVWVKLHFMNSLVLSRLLHNVHTWVVHPKALGQLNNVYMRVLRRIADRLRYDETCESSDLEVRTMLSQASIDCLLQKQRLQYLSRLVANRPKSLWAILQTTHKDVLLPWAAQMAQDLNTLYAKVSAVRDVLPEPRSNSQAWFDFFARFP